jgi:DNA adenine methylase
VRVCCGDWRRVVTDGALSHGDPIGVFLDPPYDQTMRDSTLYNHEDTVSADVREWAIEHGDNPRYRIALCGYEGEHDMPDRWRVESWKANRAYGQSNGDTANSINRGLERIWFSPACIRAHQPPLW